MSSLAQSGREKGRWRCGHRGLCSSLPTLRLFVPCFVDDCVVTKRGHFLYFLRTAIKLMAQRDMYEGAVSPTFISRRESHRPRSKQKDSRHRHRRSHAGVQAGRFKVDGWRAGAGLIKWPVEPGGSDVSGSGQE